MSEAETVAALLAGGADESPAVAAPARAPLDYAGLRAHVARTVDRLNELGIGRGDRVAIVLPNGPEMASAFVSIAAGATTAPLNPNYRRKEYDFYLGDLAAKALVVEAGSPSDSIESARSLGIAVLELHVPEGARAGEFELEADPGLPLGEASAPGPAGADDIALMLHTSGTTSRPKLVPLLQRNILASAANIRATLRLAPGDLCLNVMPLFHIHGLMAPVLASLSAGAAVSCTPGFNALRFFGWLDDISPTWYSAVPTMHQTVLARAARNRDAVARAHLRFIRSSSASLPPQVLRELEATFGAPVVEAYAMTEASHQMTCNPLPPGVRKPGCVGPAAGPEVAIMDDEGTLLEPGQVGEVVIRGPNVTPGYENNPEANAEAFTHGWFRTGDQGVMDGDRYVTLTGRLKEIINRGGEKISPKEVTRP